MARGQGPPYLVARLAARQAATEKLIYFSAGKFHRSLRTGFSGTEPGLSCALRQRGARLPPAAVVGKLGQVELEAYWPCDLCGLDSAGSGSRELGGAS